jgi:hypothetical protein
MTRLPCRARLLYPASERREVTCGFNEPVFGSIGKRCARGTANVVVYGENGQEDRIDAESLMGLRWAVLPNLALGRDYGSAAKPYKVCVGRSYSTYADGGLTRSSSM